MAPLAAKSNDLSEMEKQKKGPKPNILPLFWKPFLPFSRASESSNNKIKEVHTIISIHPVLKATMIKLLLFPVDLVLEGVQALLNISTGLKNNVKNVWRHADDWLKKSCIPNFGQWGVKSSDQTWRGDKIDDASRRQIQENSRIGAHCK
ncbi:hypothetical protein DKX38_019106 [Salix brachista]|uniref:Uncharacterized protein n=1 Tax=Salix brachista TaxID=2182728 RepID=A0A5N5KQG9_9ROSI|nr:hypothetical protein DKX38_019106 [Salix brachista]